MTVGNSIAERYKTQGKMPRIRLSIEAKCAASAHCFPVSGNAASQLGWLDGHDLYVAKDRVFTLVDTTREVFFMDAVTGSLYQFGQCLTHAGFRFDSFVKNQKKGEKLLLSISTKTHSAKPVAESELLESLEVVDDGE